MLFHSNVLLLFACIMFCRFFNLQFMGENAVWQDPEGEVRKWQRDTGTAAWGDPEKQQSLFVCYLLKYMSCIPLNSLMELDIVLIDKLVSKFVSEEIKRWIIPVGKEYDSSDSEGGKFYTAICFFNKLYISIQFKIYLSFK